MKKLTSVPKFFDSMNDIDITIGSKKIVDIIHSSHYLRPDKDDRGYEEYKDDNDLKDDARVWDKANAVTPVKGINIIYEPVNHGHILIFHMGKELDKVKAFMKIMMTDFAHWPECSPNHDIHETMNGHIIILSETY